MSKATVQMCLSTTGFGSRAPLLGPPKPRHIHSSSSQSIPQVPAFFQAQNGQGSFRPQRPRPQFDMNLRDLFPEEAQERNNVARNIRSWQFPPQSGGPPALTPQNSMYAGLGAGQDSTANPYQNQQQLPNAMSPYGQNFQMSPVPPAMVSQGSQDEMGESGGVGGLGETSGESGMDYANSNNNVNDFSFPSDMDFLLADTTAQYTGNPGLSLGFDSEHDWSEGAGVDLFDGFFFGGQGNYGGSAGGALR